MEAREAERRERNIASLGTMLGMDGIELAVSSGETSEWTDGATGAPTGPTGGFATNHQPAFDPFDNASRPHTEEAPDTEVLPETVTREVECRVHMEREAVRAQMEFLVDQLRALDASMESPPAAVSVPRTASLPTARTRPVGPAPSLPEPRTRPIPQVPTVHPTRVAAATTPTTNPVAPAAVPKRYFMAIGPGGLSGIRETWQSAVALVGVDSTILEYPDLDSSKPR
jgi:cell division protein FtsN